MTTSASVLTLLLGLLCTSAFGRQPTVVKSFAYVYEEVVSNFISIDKVSIVKVETNSIETKATFRVDGVYESGPCGVKNPLLQIKYINDEFLPTSLVSEQSLALSSITTGAVIDLSNPICATISRHSHFVVDIKVAVNVTARPLRDHLFRYRIPCNAHLGSGDIKIQWVEVLWTKAAGWSARLAND